MHCVIIQLNAFLAVSMGHAQGLASVHATLDIQEDYAEIVS